MWLDRFKKKKKKEIDVETAFENAIQRYEGTQPRKEVEEAPDVETAFEGALQRYDKSRPDYQPTEEEQKPRAKPVDMMEEEKKGVADYTKYGKKYAKAQSFVQNIRPVRKAWDAIIPDNKIGKAFRGGEIETSVISGSALKWLGSEVNSEKIKSFAEGYRQEHLGELERKGLGATGEEGRIEQTIRATPLTLSQVSVAIFAGLATGPIGAKAVGGLSMGALEGGGAYQEAMDRGATEDQAQVAARITGSINGAIEVAIPWNILNSTIGKVLPKTVLKKAKKEISKSIAKQVLKKTGKFAVSSLKQAAGEGAQEYVQEVVSNLAARYAYDPSQSWNENARGSGEVGALMGLMFSFVPGVGGRQLHIQEQAEQPPKPLEQEPVEKELAKEKPASENVNKTFGALAEDDKEALTELLPKMSQEEILEVRNSLVKMERQGKKDALEDRKMIEDILNERETKSNETAKKILKEGKLESLEKLPVEDRKKVIGVIEKTKDETAVGEITKEREKQTKLKEEKKKLLAERKAKPEQKKEIQTKIDKIDEKRRDEFATAEDVWKVVDEADKRFKEKHKEIAPEAREGVAKTIKEEKGIKTQEGELERIREANPTLVRKARKAKSKSEFVSLVLNGKPKSTVDIPTLDNFFDKIKKLEAKTYEHKQKTTTKPKGISEPREAGKPEPKKVSEKTAEAREKQQVGRRVEEDGEKLKAKKKTDKKEKYQKMTARGSENAAIGIFTEGEVKLGGLDKIRPLEFPELVDLARELMNDVPTLKNFQKALGRFYGEGKGKIKLTTNLFKKGQERQLASVLAHEIGHLIDHLPQQTLKRGNLLGRLLSLRGFLKNTYGDLSNKELRAELKEASSYWRPTNDWNAYRNSAKELYADAISMLLVSPGKLQELAPSFYNNFFESLDNKPSVKKAYFELQEILRGDKKSIIERRRAGVRQMFNEADYKAKDLQIIKEKEKEIKKKNFWNAFKFTIKSVNQEVYSKAEKVEKQGGYINPDYNPKYLLEERNYLGSLIKAQFTKFVQPIHINLQENNISWDDLGEILMYERIISGDRSEIANPRGISPKEAQEMLDGLKQELGKKRTKILEDNLIKFREFNQSIIDEAYKQGLIKEEMYKRIQDNPKYATYRVIEYMDENVDWKMKHQIGTLKDIDNPANAMLLKIISSIRATHNQKIRVFTVELLEKNYREDIENAKTVWTGKIHAPIKPKNRSQELITYYVKGKLKGKYVDVYIAYSINNNTIGKNKMVAKLLSPITFLNRKFFRPIFVIYNPGWVPFNFVRDFVRFWKNTPNMSLLKATKRYFQAGKIAKARVTGKDGAGKELLTEMEQNMVINTLTWNDFMEGETTEDKQVVDILKRTGVMEIENKKYHPLLKPIIAIGRAIRSAGDYVETLPKAAGFIEVRENLTPEKASFIRRKAGSPDFFEKGYLTPATNEIFLFSNPFIQAWFADVEVATNPKTRSGFWWKTVAKEFVPKLIMFGLLLGLFGDDGEEIMEGVSEYDKTNYFIIPIGIDEISGKSIYFRMPTDETGRVLGGIFWKLLKLAKGDKEAIKQITQVLDYAGGQVPSLTPSIGSPFKIAEFLQGKNPYDDFRGRNIISETEFKAGGWAKTKPFLGWIFQQSGGNIFIRFNVSTYEPREKTTGEKILKLPLVSNVIGRWIKVSDYGKREKLREDIIDPAEKERAKEKLEDRKVINKYIKEHRDTNKSVGSLERKMVKEIIGRTPLTKEEKTKSTSLKRQFRVGLAYGQSDTKISALMEAGTNDIKAKLLKEFDEEMTRDEFNKFKRILLKYKVVSSSLLRSYRKLE